ncbi:MAG: epoxyqueuosine reductase QueH [bacterium]|nr:epoxyqueuosine reductase QueH [bacterium]
MKQNYQIILEREIKKITDAKRRPRLLMHACCAPCSSYVMEYLASVFDMTMYFYNPNISPESELIFRGSELERLIHEMPLSGHVELIRAEYEHERFIEIARGMEQLPEGGERCFKCYELRLRKTAEYAKENGFEYFSTTLSISPHKNSQKLNEIGSELSEEYGIPYLFSDFKKRGGYKRSCELSAEYNLYRQNYCGCIYSKAQSIKSLSVN